MGGREHPSPEHLFGTLPRNLSCQLPINDIFYEYLGEGGKEKGREGAIRAIESLT